MLQPAINGKSFFSRLFFSFAAFLVLILSLGIGSNFWVSSEQNVSSALTPTTINALWSDLGLWPEWFHQLDHVESKSSLLKTHETLTLSIVPSKKHQKPFLLTFELTEFEPNKMLELKFLNDSSSRVNQLFSDLTWRIELSEQNKKTHIRAVMKAQTKTFKARLFSRLASRILLNQLFYPNLIAFTQPREHNATENPKMF